MLRARRRVGSRLASLLKAESLLASEVDVFRHFHLTESFALFQLLLLTRYIL